MLFNKIVCLALICINLSGCIIVPLYYHSEKRPSQFDIAPIAERRGQVLRNLLQEKLRLVPCENSTHYQVLINLVKTHEAAGYNTDLTTTITRVNITADVTLSPLNASKPMFFKLTASDFYINAVSTFAMAKAEEDVEQRLLITLADHIIMKISALLKVTHAERP
jgi:hypothetical protein